MAAAAAAAAGWMCVLAALLSGSTALGHGGETDVYRVSAGRLFLLRCPGSDASSRVSWRRGAAGGPAPGPAPGLPAGVEVRGALLWFMPVLSHHNGTYSCERSCENRPFRMTFLLSVTSDPCPDPSEVRTIPESISGELPCKQEDVFSLDSPRDVRWMKECRSVQQHRQEGDRGGLRLLAASQRDAGKYTCLVEVTVDGRKFTAARSVQLNIESDPVLVEPQVVIPQEDVIIVQVGMRADVKCIAYIGLEDDEEIFTYWTVNGSYTETLSELSESSERVSDGGKVFWHSTLSVSRVSRDFLDVPITCHVQSMLAHKEGSARLREADHSVFYLTVSLCLVASVSAVVLLVLFPFFKVDLVLAYRKLLTHFPKPRAPDGKLYDAYVSFLRRDAVGWPGETERFALRILPEQLEDRHGYSLFIPGRDDCPGEAMHDAISSTVSQCRRLIIVLSPEEAPSSYDLGDLGDRLCYEQQLGLYDALTQSRPRVILVESGGAVDYSRLPESLRYVKRRHGALRWNDVHPGRGKLSRLHTERTFWKNLRYHMPPVPARRRQTVV